jgi:hypothetical protein
MVEQFPFKELVVGSSPTVSTNLLVAHRKVPTILTPIGMVGIFVIQQVFEH